jgi:hypothetical protein
MFSAEVRAALGIEGKRIVESFGRRENAVLPIS